MAGTPIVAAGFGQAFPGSLTFPIFVVSGLVCSALVIVGATLQYSNEASRIRRGSILVLVFTVVGIPFTFFGFVLGGVLGIVGATLGFSLGGQPPIVLPSRSSTAPPTSAAEGSLLESKEPERRLSAIMFTDLVGYSSISHVDEDEALRLVDEQRKIVRPLIAKHEGKEIKTIGDAFLVEFPSAVEAVRCAIDVQQSIHDFDLIKPRRVKTLLRIGIHVGEVVHSERDVYGDAVNVASRIQALAPPGGICVSRQAFENVRSQVDLQFNSIGLQRLRNIADDYEVFKADLPWTTSA